MLTCRTDEQAAEQIRQRRMIIPEREQALQQIRPAKERAIRCGWSAKHEVISATRTGVPAIELKLLGRQSREFCLFVNCRRGLDDFVPVVSRVNVDFDHTGI